MKVYYNLLEEIYISQRKVVMLMTAKKTQPKEKSKGENYVKGGAFDSKRMDCRTEAMEESRKVSGRYANVGFRLVRIEN